MGTAVQINERMSTTEIIDKVSSWSIDFRRFINAITATSDDVNRYRSSHCNDDSKTNTELPERIPNDKLRSLPQCKRERRVRYHVHSDKIIQKFVGLWRHTVHFGP